MKAEEARKIADHALEQLAEALRQGKSARLTEYLKVLARFHRYSFGNVMLILWQMPAATHVAGFHTWRQLGRFVRKGEKAITIIAPMMIRPKVDEGRAESEAKPAAPRLRFRGVSVFDVSQTDGQPLPEPEKVTGDPAGHLDRLHKLIAEEGITLDSDDLPMRADGVSRGGRISIRPGLAPAEAFSVTVHELAHEMLHRGADRPASKTVRETEAEAVAFVVCQAIGLNTGTAASDYIQLYEGSTETLAASLDRIQKTAARIIEGMHSRQVAHEAAASA